MRRRTSTLTLLAASITAGCAHPGPELQSIEVQVDAESPAWAGPLACRASNAAGSWSFTAPGSVTVVPSASPLQLACDVPAGAVAEPSITPSASPSAREGAATGAKVGAGAGVALGAAAAPVMGGAFAVLIVAGAAMKGGEVGGIIGAMRRGESHRYPGTLVLHLRSEQRGVSPEP